MKEETITRNFISALNRLFDILESLEKNTDRLEEADSVYERIVSEMRTDLQYLWIVSDRLSKRVERLKD